MPPGRLLIVSNRLPISAQTGSAGVTLTPASGGLTTGLRPWHERSGGLSIGWPGDGVREHDTARAATDDALAVAGIVAVHLSREHIDRYYRGFANRVLWPLFHYLIDRVPLHAAGWDAYCQVNEVFAETVVREYRDGDTIWIHDYQLMLLPALLRQRRPDARIGFFLHVPFPSSEVFRVLPWRRELLWGLLGADLIGFHTFSYLRHFVAALRHVIGLDVDIDRVHTDDRRVSLGVFPMGVDATGFATLAADPAVVAAADTIRRESGNRQIVLGIDRLDYTKGIPRRLEAMDRLFARHPRLRRTVRYIQVAIPSRGEVDSYQRFRRQVEEAVGRINGEAGTLSSTPIHYLHRSLSTTELVALYRAADVMAVTPLRDGMNLVAKEFVASRVDGDGVLLLSEFAGAAAELDGPIVVNPYDVHRVADGLFSALTMPPGERQARMVRMRERVTAYDVHAWARAFLERLEHASADAARPMVCRTEPALREVLEASLRQPQVRFLLDYDGTLVPFATAPGLASPDTPLLTLLERLAALPGVAVDIVSGRSRESLEAWLGALPIGLWAEHGVWSRRAPGVPWARDARFVVSHMERILPILEQFTHATPGSYLERKSASVAWHYRRAAEDFGARQAHELRMLLSEALSNQPLEVLEGNKVLEVRLRGISKAVAARQLAHAADTAVIAIGDDRTDEDLFTALPSSSVTVAVGRVCASARYQVADHVAVRRLLELAVTWRAASAPSDFEAHESALQKARPA